MTTPKKIDNNGIQIEKSDDTEKIILSPNDGLTINYDLLTSNPKTFKISSTGFNYIDNTNNYLTALERISLVQEAFEAVELPPNTSTLKINDTLELNNGVDNGKLFINASGNIELSSNNNIELNELTIFNILPVSNILPSSGIQLVNKNYVDSKVGNYYYFDDMLVEGSNSNGILGFRLGGSGSGSSSMANAENNRFGIVRIQNPSSNSNTTWTTISPFIWSNINYVEFVFRGWSIGTSNNTTLSIGLLDNTSNLDTNIICLMYSTNISPINTWHIRVNNNPVYSFNTSNFPQMVNTWLKIRFTNLSNIGGWSASFTRLDTNINESISGVGIPTGNQFYLGGGISCVSGAVPKRLDFDSVELQLKSN